jgi:predicted DNA-binding protein with PD1-like motif
MPSYRFTPTALLMWGGLLAWAAAFLFAYAFTAIVCARQWQAKEVLGLGLVPTVTAAAVLLSAGAMLLVLRAARRRRAAGQGDALASFVAWVTVAGVGLGLLALGLLLLPMLLPPPACTPGAAAPVASGSGAGHRARRKEAMDYTLIHRDDATPPQRTWALVLEKGDEVTAALQGFAREQRLAAAHFSAIGAFSGAVLGFFEWERKSYLEIPLDEQVEVLSLVGDVALKDGTPSLHAHVTVAKRDGSAWGGHLLRATVRPTLEVVLTESTGVLRRRLDAETGLALIRLGPGQADE